MSRAEKSDSSKLAILRAVHELVPVLGYSGTGIAEVVRIAGLTKGALFHHFPDKRSLIAAWMQQILLPEIREIWLNPLPGVQSVDDLKRVLAGNIDGLSGKDAFSCLVTLSAEISAADEALRVRCEEIFQEWRNGFSELFARGKEGIWVFRSVDPEAEASLLLALSCGVVICRKGLIDSDSRRQWKAISGYLETLKIL